MNLFYIDTDPQAAGVAHMDSHVIKMPLEHAQLVCTAASLFGIATPYHPSHAGHPIRKWVSQSQANLAYLVDLTEVLNAEYQYRWKKDVNHKSWEVVQEIAPILARKLPKAPFTAPYQAMPQIYRRVDSVLAYRAYYEGGKSHLATWKNRTPPLWWKFEEQLTIWL